MYRQYTLNVGRHPNGFTKAAWNVQKLISATGEIIIIYNIKIKMRK